MHFGLNPPACAGSISVCASSVVPDVAIVTSGPCGVARAQEVENVALGMTEPHPLTARQVELGMVEPPCTGWPGKWVGTR